MIDSWHHITIRGLRPSHPRIPVYSLIGAVVLLGLTAAPAAAQRRPHGVPPGLGKPKPTSNSTSTPTPQSGANVVGNVDGAPVTRIRAFGSWLDDASGLAPGEAWLSLSVQRWASPTFNGADLPIADVSVGVVDGVHAFVTLPVTRYGYVGEPRTSAVGDVYVGTKVVLRSPDATGVGFSVTPALEILGTDSMVDGGLPRMSLVVPVNFEVRQDGGRVYGSGGFFTRGAWFVGSALERHATERLILTGALTFMRSTDDVTVSEALGLHHSRLDATGSAAWVLSPAALVYAGVGRTLSSMDVDSTRYAFSVGASINLRRPGAPRPPLTH